VNWEARAGALAPLQPPAGEQYTCYWAPEVMNDNGVFYLYYSVGDEEHMHIRAATSTEPGGPFIDSGHRLTSEQFAIDAHVFTDDDGARYLFYAADFLDHTHIGTGIVVDRMLDVFHLAGNPQPVARARFDWQVYDPNRAEKGGVRWHTVEGPFVLKRKGRYYLMFSGGNWQNDSYGLAYAISDRMEFLKEWEQPCDGDCTRPILKSNQAQGVIGPGHNSVVRGPDNRQLYCVYHRWNQEVGARVMAIDRLEWVGERLAVLGPSTGQEEYEVSPAELGWREETGQGRWLVQRGSLQQSGAAEQARVFKRLPFDAGQGYQVAINARLVDPDAGNGSYQFYPAASVDALGPIFSVRPGDRWELRAEFSSRAEIARLPDNFDPYQFQHFRFQLGPNQVRAYLEDEFLIAVPIDGAPDRVGLGVMDAQAAFDLVRVTL
jgi:GH43 family beta-xylosidase